MATYKKGSYLETVIWRLDWLVFAQKAGFSEIKNGQQIKSRGKYKWFVFYILYKAICI